MKAIIYSVRKDEKELLTKTNAGKHELVWQISSLKNETVNYAAGCEAVVVFTGDEVSCSVIIKLAQLGVKYLLTRSSGTDHIDFEAAKQHRILIKNIPGYAPHAVAEHTLALALALSRHLIEANRNCRNYDFSLSGLTGFNLHEKTVGIIGFGRIGKITARVFRGLGCKVIVYDNQPPSAYSGIKLVSFEDLLSKSDIISLHIPLNDETLHIISEEKIRLMKDGVMLINTARGGLVDTRAVLAALDTSKIGYYGTDVYEFERGLFFEDHETDQVRDVILSTLMNHRNVLVTPHQAFLTIEALKEIAFETIKGLDEWEEVAKPTRISSDFDFSPKL